jgi:hypothetical protein
MMDEIDPLPFILAEKLGKSLQEIDELPYSEIVAWRAFYRYRTEMEALHAKR